MKFNNFLKKSKKEELWALSIYISPIIIYCAMFFSQLLVRSKDFMTNSHFEIINGTGLSPFQYRILTPYLINFLNQFFSFNVAYLAVVFVFTLISVILLHVILRDYFDVKETILIVLFFISSLICSIFGGYFADSLNMMFFFLGFIMIKQKKFLILLLIIFIATFNRETSAFLVLFYFAYNFRYNLLKSFKKLMKFLANNFLLFLAWLIPYVGLRICFGLRTEANVEMTGRYIQLFHNLLPSNLAMLFTFLGVIWILAYVNIKNNDLFTKRMLYAIPIFVLIHFFMGHINETRLFLPITPPLLISGFSYLFKKLRRDKNE